MKLKTSENSSCKNTPKASQIKNIHFTRVDSKKLPLLNDLVKEKEKKQEIKNVIFQKLSSRASETKTEKPAIECTKTCVFVLKKEMQNIERSKSESTLFFHPKNVKIPTKKLSSRKKKKLVEISELSTDGGETKMGSNKEMSSVKSVPKVVAKRRSVKVPSKYKYLRNQFYTPLMTYQTNITQRGKDTTGKKSLSGCSLGNFNSYLFLNEKLSKTGYYTKREESFRKERKKESVVKKKNKCKIEGGIKNKFLYY